MNIGDKAKQCCIRAADLAGIPTDECLNLVSGDSTPQKLFNENQGVVGEYLACMAEGRDVTTCCQDG